LTQLTELFDAGDDVVSTSYSALDSVSFRLRSTLTEEERAELTVEVQFYGLLRLMMPTAVPYYVQEQIGVALLRGACAAGTKGALQTAVAQARALVFEMGSTTPWLVAKYQDVRYVITDRVVNGAPVWAAEGGDWFMWRDGQGQMMISNEANWAAGNSAGVIYNTVGSLDVLAPTQLLSNQWRSFETATLGPQLTSAPARYAANAVVGLAGSWVDVPDMRVTSLHGLDDAEPAMAAALRQLAALPGDE